MVAVLNARSRGCVRLAIPTEEPADEETDIQERAHALRTESRRLNSRPENRDGQDTVPNAGAKESPMRKRTESRQPTQAENGTGPELGYL
jgi:hypothetical protein